MSAVRWRWMRKGMFCSSGAPRLLQVLVISFLIGTLPSAYAADARSHDQEADDAFHHFVAGIACADARDSACVNRESSWLASSPLSKLGQVLTGYKLYREKSYAQAIRTMGGVYPVMPDKAVSQEVLGFYEMGHELAATVIGESMYRLKQPDSKVLPVLLEGTRFKRMNGLVVDDEALSIISKIFLREGRTGLSFGFELERYNALKKRYAKEPPGTPKRKMARYLHQDEFGFSLLLVYLGDMNASAKWLEKASRDKNVDYLEKARAFPELKPVLDALGAVTPTSKRSHGSLGDVVTH